MTPRYANRKDGNQKQMESDLWRLGYHVWDTSSAGDGGPDTVITGYRHSTGKVEALLCEMKMERGILTPKQVVWHAAYPIDGPLLIGRKLEDILEWFQGEE